MAIITLKDGRRYQERTPNGSGLPLYDQKTRGSVVRPHNALYRKGVVLDAPEAHGRIEIIGQRQDGANQVRVTHF